MDKRSDSGRDDYIPPLSHTHRRHRQRRLKMLTKINESAFQRVEVANVTCFYERFQPPQIYAYMPVLIAVAAGDLGIT